MPAACTATKKETQQLPKKCPKPITDARRRSVSSAPQPLKKQKNMPLVTPAKHRDEFTLYSVFSPGGCTHGST